jgi:hypothetical protein
MSNLINALPAGKKLAKSQLNAIAKMEQFGVTLPAQAEIRSNPFTGVQVELCPLAVAMFDFITLSYKNYLATRGVFSFNGHKFTVSTWDNSRYAFLALWPDAYYNLID